MCDTSEACVGAMRPGERGPGPLPGAQAAWTYPGAVALHGHDGVLGGLGLRQGREVDAEQ